MFRRVKKRLRLLVQQFVIDSDRSYRYVRNNLKFLAWVGVICFPAFAVTDAYFGASNHNTLWIRLSGAAVCLPLLSPRFRPAVLERRFSFYWIFSVFFLFPFMFGQMLVVNAALTPVGAELPVFWILQYFVSLFLFVQLTSSALIATVGWSVSVLLLFLSLLFVQFVNWEEIQRVFFYEVTAFLTTVVIGSWVNRNVELVQQEKIEAVQSVGQNVAHEMRTPLLGIQLKASAIRRVLPILLDTYRDASLSGSSPAHIDKRDLSNISLAADDIIQETIFANTIIDMLLVSTGERNLSSFHDERFDVYDLVRECVDRYPFANDSERKLVSVDVQSSFVLTAPKILLLHVLFNLLKNALHFAQKKQGGVVVVSVFRDGERGVVAVRDTGPGIPLEIQARIYERFFTTKKAGTGSGIGLSFCKVAVEELGGSILCESELGEFAKFSISFPGYRVSDAIVQHQEKF